MKLNPHSDGIVDRRSWEEKRPPRIKSLQWKEGRSAMSLADYITAALPNVPQEMEQVLKEFTAADAAFDWDAEYVTPLPGYGNGRNHDALLFNKDLVVGIEAKADETLGRLIKEEIATASVNKLHRISSLLQMIFRDGFSAYGDLRYQLLTAAAGILLEAQIRGGETALLLVIVFKTDQTTAEKIQANNVDIENFLKATNAVPAASCMLIPNNTDIKLYFKKIEIER